MKYFTNELYEAKVLLEKLTNRPLVSQEIPHILYNPEVHYRIYNSRPPAQVLSPINSVYAPSTSCRSILILFSHLRLSIQNGLFRSDLHTNTLNEPLLFPISTTCPTNLIRINFVAR